MEVTGITTGTITDYGIKDSMNMGACMAPAACDAILHNFKDMGIGPDYYDCIVTGDLGTIGQRILIDMLRGYGYDIEKQHFDCGTEIYYNKEQGTNAGGSGCGCSAITLCGYILQKMKKKEWKRVLFVPTGALLSTVSFNEGNSIPALPMQLCWRKFPAPERGWENGLCNSVFDWRCNLCDCAGYYG